jgi:hypothetical protein
MGAITTLALLATAAAVCVPVVARRLRQRTPLAEETARRVDSAVSRGLQSMGDLAEAYAGAAVEAVRPVAGGSPPAASLPDGPVNFPNYSADSWEGPLDPPLSIPRWGFRPLFWKPVFTRPAPWYFYRRPPWRVGGRLRK